MYPSTGLSIYLLHLSAPSLCIHRTCVCIHRTCVSKVQLRIASTETSAAGTAEASALETSAAEVAVTRQQLRAARREIDDLRGEITERRVGDERRAEATATAAAATAAAATAAAAAARSPPRSPAEARSPFGDEGTRQVLERESARQASALTSRVQHLEMQVEHEVLRAHEAAQRQQASEVQAHHASQMLGAMQATLQREGAERGKLAASLCASHRQLETAQAALQSKELTIAKMRSRMGSSNANSALAQDMARLGYTLGLKST